MKQSGVQNKKGMTLVEMIVALAISVMVILSAASIFLAVQRYYNKTVETNLNKLSADAVYNLIADRLVYAGQVFAFREEEPALESQLGDSWHSIRVDHEGRLLLDNQDVYGSSYYRGRTLSITFRPDGYRASLRVSLSGESEEGYHTDSSMLLLNLRAAEAKVETTYLGSEHTAVTGSELTSPQLYLYYNTVSTVTPETTARPLPSWPVDPGWPFQNTGTVADEYGQMNAGNTVNVDDWLAGKVGIRPGQFILHNGEVYRCMKAPPDAAPGFLPTEIPSFWKKIQMDWNSGSIYDTGNVVRYGSKYYQSTGKENSFPIFENGIFNSRFWQEVKADLDASTNENIIWVPV